MEYFYEVRRERVRDWRVYRRKAHGVHWEQVSEHTTRNAACASLRKLSETPTSREMIQAICESMGNWDAEELLQWAKNIRRDLLLMSPTKQIKEEYQEVIK
jgi:hypothetical protein